MNLRSAVSFSIAIITVALAADAPLVLTPGKVLEDYKKMERITKEPKSLGADLKFTVLCAPEPAMNRVKNETGPHAMHYLNYYLNNVAQFHRDSGSEGAYPSGSVIVKEKLLAAADGQDKDFQVSAVAGMIKREPGSSPETGDWEFFYFNSNPRAASDGGMVSAWQKETEMKSCVSCHSNAVDMVFARFNQRYGIVPKDDKSRVTIKLEESLARKLPGEPAR